MAMQAGIGVSRILVLAGAGYTGTILLQNGKLSELLGELQKLVKGYEGKDEGDSSDYTDAVAQQVKRLAMEVRQLSSARQITVFNGNSQTGNLTGLIVPAAVLGAVGYGYMWWKGLKFSDFMYVTKRSMANAVTNLTKHLHDVTEALSAAKKHLTQRIQHLDDKMDTQKEISKSIQNDVNTANTNISQIGSDLWHLQNLVSGLDGKVLSLEQKQDLSNMGIQYLCNFVDGKSVSMSKALELQDNLKSSLGARGSLGPPDVLSLTGLRELSDDNYLSRTTSELVANRAKSLHRLNSARC